MKTKDSASSCISLTDLIDIAGLQDLTDSFSHLSGIPSAILDLHGEILITSGWQPICTEFHRNHPITAERCRKSDTILAAQSAQGEKVALYKCQNGLVDVVAPIVIEQTYMGYVFIGQFLLEPPDDDFFCRQAEECEFDLDSYRRALAQVPVLSLERVRQAAEFLANLTAVIGNAGRDRLELFKLTEELESRVEERTADLQAEIRRRKKTEAKLQESKKFLDSVLDAIQDGICVMDRDLNIIRANSVMYQWYPQLATSLGKKCYTIFHGRTEPCEFCPSIHAFRSRKMERAEIPYRVDDDVIGIQEIFTFPMVDKLGNVEGVVVHLRDITVNKLIEERIEKEKKFSESLIHSLPGIMYVFDQSGRFLRWNKNVEIISGYTSEQVERMTPLDFIAVEDRPRVEESINRVFSLGSSNVEGGFQTSTGAVIPYLFTGYRLVQDGRNFLVGIGLDISARVGMEKEKEELIKELEATLSQVKQLSGLLPICAECKKIRDDKGYWNQIESYIKNHSEAKFSHGICPDCAKKLYPDLPIWQSVDAD